MKVTHESTGELTARINLDFTEEDYKDRVNKQLKELAKKANIPRASVQEKCLLEL